MPNLECGDDLKTSATPKLTHNFTKAGIHAKWDVVLKPDFSEFVLEKCSRFSAKRNSRSITQIELEDMKRFGSPVDLCKKNWWNRHCYMCATCDWWLDGMCLKHPLIFVKEKTPSKVPFSVFDTFPPFFYLADSTIPHAGKGVFTKVDLPSGLAFGPYTGVIVTGKDAECSGYSWQIFANDDMSQYMWVDAVDFQYSNWMRYANAARFCQEQNMVGYQHGNYMYYFTFKPIKAHSEIMVWYGTDYGMCLKIPKAEKTFGYKAPIKKMCSKR